MMSLIAAAIVVSVLGVATADTTTRDAVARKVDLSTVRITEVGKDTYTTKLLSNMNAAATAQVQNVAQIDIANIGKQSAFLFSADWIKANKNDESFKQFLKTAMDKRGVVMAVGNNTDILGSALESSGVHGGFGTGGADTPVVAYKITDYTDIAGNPRQLYHEYHSGTPEGYYDDSDKQKLAEWLTN
jgi:hypothetical protein